MMSHKYRILCPNVMWIRDSLPGDPCNLDSLEGAMRLAKLAAKAATEYGDYLIFEVGKDQPAGRFQMVQLVEDE